MLMAGFINTAFDVLKKNTVDPVKRINSETQNAKLFDKPGTMVAETIKEGLVRLPLENIARISNWTGKAIFSLIGKTLKTGLAAATLMPLPFPGGINSIADARGRMHALGETIRLKSQGNPESFKELFARIRGVRDDARNHAIKGETPALAA
jgi:hypothetical protein